MLETRSSKTEYLADQKRKFVQTYGCTKCGAGIETLGFERYWSDNPDEFDYQYTYDARRFVFKYVDTRGSDVPVAKLPRMKNSTKETIDHALARCVILCRSCADPRRTRKDDQCKKTTTESSLPSS
jgi:hypothetical protein